MAKLSVNAKPTFTATVEIPVAGEKPVPVLFTFKHRTKDQLMTFMESREGVSDAETFLEMVSGWDFAEELNAANAAAMLQNYIGAALATYRAYIDELLAAKVKN